MGGVLGGVSGGERFPSAGRDLSPARRSSSGYTALASSVTGSGSFKDCTFGPNYEIRQPAELTSDWRSLHIKPDFVGLPMKPAFPEDAIDLARDFAGLAVFP